MEMWFAASVGLLSVVLAVAAWLVRDKISATDRNVDRVGQKVESLGDKMEKQFGIVHGRVSEVAERVARMEGKERR